MSLHSLVSPRQRCRHKLHAVPACSTGSQNGFLFSVRPQVEGCRQMQGGFVERQALHCRPEIENIALGAALGVETLKNMFAEMRREGALGIVWRAVQRARATALLAAAAP